MRLVSEKPVRNILGLLHVLGLDELTSDKLVRDVQLRASALGLDSLGLLGLHLLVKVHLDAVQAHPLGQVDSGLISLVVDFESRLVVDVVLFLLPVTRLLLVLLLVLILEVSLLCTILQVTLHEVLTLDSKPPNFVRWNHSKE